jgi:signal transduction histidine kinase
MNAFDDVLTLARSDQSHDLATLLGPGVLSLEPEGNLRFADRRALELLGCANVQELKHLWEELRPRLESAGLSWSTGGDNQRTSIQLPVAESAASTTVDSPQRSLLFDLRDDGKNGGTLLVQDLMTLAGLEADLRLTSQMRSVAQISPAVAHDLRAPINAMVFNIEVLRQMISSGRASDPANQSKLLRYADVLGEELSRLHRGLETFLAFISPRSDKLETIDLRELAEELASLLVAPARKQQVQVESEFPEQPLLAAGNRYLLRQALLHLALAALTEVARQGILHVRLERLNGRALLRVYGIPGADRQPEPGNAEAPAAGFDLRFSPSGAEARLWVARSILVAHGGEARRVSTVEATGDGRAYEIDLAVLGNQEDGAR